MELDLQVSPEEIMSREAKVGLLLFQVVQVIRQQQCNGHCLCDSVQSQQLKEQLHKSLGNGGEGTPP